MYKLLFAPIIMLATMVWSPNVSVDTAIAPQGGVEWLTWEQAMEKSKTEKRKIFVDVYTEWCGWCRKMEASTFKDPVIANYINNNFYAVKFDAEQKESIEFNGKEYKFVKSGKRGYHELAAWMTNGKLGYPTVVFINENQKVIQPIPGYLPAEKFEPIMTYFGGDHYKKTPWDIYQKKYRGEKTNALPASEKND